MKQIQGRFLLQSNKDFPADCEMLDLKQAEDATVVVIVYRSEAEGGKIAANARSPVILNTHSRKGMQKILQEVHPTLLYRAR